jgi:predicted transcriptional regulator
MSDQFTPEDKPNTISPLSSELIEIITQSSPQAQKQGVARLTSQHLRKINRLLARIETGCLTIQKQNGRLIAVNVMETHSYSMDDLEND